MTICKAHRQNEKCLRITHPSFKRFSSWFLTNNLWRWQTGTYDVLCRWENQGIERCDLPKITSKKVAKQNSDEGLLLPELARGLPLVTPPRRWAFWFPNCRLNILKFNMCIDLCHLHHIRIQMVLPLHKSLLCCLFVVTEACLQNPGKPSSVPYYYSLIGIVFTYLQCSVFQSWPQYIPPCI